MNSSPLTVSGICKTLRTPFARRPGFRLGPLNLCLAQGEIVGLVGANGAGKTTAIKLILGLLLPDGGRVEIAGLPSTSAAWRFSVGYLPEQPSFYDYLSGREFLTFMGELLGGEKALFRERIPNLLDRVGIAESADRPLRTYSKGMLQRLGLAQALLNDPQLLILDEPMSGLDPLGRRFVRDLLLELKDQGKSILFSTHIIPDAEFVCDRIAVMRAGQLTAVGTLDELLGAPTGFEISSVRSPQNNDGSTKPPERVTVRVAPTELTGAIERILGAGGHLVGVAPIRASIEDLLSPAKKGGS